MPNTPSPHATTAPHLASLAKARRQLGIGLTLAILLDTGLQIFWKMAVLDIPDQPTLWQTARDMLHQPVFLLVGIFMAAQCFNWMAVLDHADLSYAHAITSLSYISVAVLSVLYLGEVIDLAQILGIALILAGVWCVGKSGHSSVPQVGKPS